MMERGVECAKWSIQVQGRHCGSSKFSTQEVRPYTSVVLLEPFANHYIEPGLIFAHLRFAMQSITSAALASEAW
jgi:hypothetical protein